jgi:hypothetical protein
MYYYDARSVNWLWAGFLGLLRLTVYCLLAVCFLLPGCQEYDITVTESKVLVLFDVSGSMDAADGQESEVRGPAMAYLRRIKPGNWTALSHR